MNLVVTGTIDLELVESGEIGIYRLVIMQYHQLYRHSFLQAKGLIHF